MRIVIAGFVGLLLAGCSALERPEVKRCEERLISDLKSPATYKPVAKQSVRIEKEKARYQLVSIEYDAQNSFGALMRETHFCAAPIDGTDVRDDLLVYSDNEFHDAADGKGYFSTAAKLPSRESVRDDLQRTVDAIVNETK